MRGDMISMSDNLLYIFNNQYERNVRHQDTYYTDKPGLSKEEINNINKRNYEVLISDTLKQIQSIPEYFDNTSNIKYIQDNVYQDLQLYQSYDNIDDFIEDYFLKRIG